MFVSSTLNSINSSTHMNIQVKRFHLYLDKEMERNEMNIQVVKRMLCM